MFNCEKVMEVTLEKRGTLVVHACRNQDVWVETAARKRRLFDFCKSLQK